MKPPESSANGATSPATPLSQAEIKAMRVRLASLWNVQADAAHPEELRVTVRIRLNRNRRLAAPPQVVSSGTSPEYQAAADAAVRAVVQGQPYTMLRYETYEQWKYMDIDFDPKQMFHKREAESTAGEYTPASPSPVASSPAVVSQAAKKEANWQPVNLPPNVDGTAYSYDRNSIAIITDEHGQMNGAEMAAKIVGGDVSIRGKSLLLSFDCNGSGRFRINHSYPLKLPSTSNSVSQEDYLANIACGAASCEIDRRQNGNASICHF
jgi:hypothetical protein